MGLQAGVGSYADFKSVVNNLPEKIFAVFYSNVTGNAFNAIAITHSGNYLVGVGVMSATPASLLTDFPGAIQLTGVDISIHNGSAWSKGDS